MDECSLHLSSNALDELAANLWEEAEGNDVITYEQLEGVLRKRPGVVEGLTQRYYLYAVIYLSCKPHSLCDFQTCFYNVMPRILYLHHIIDDGRVDGMHERQ